jgi:hypothetical protein
MTIKRKLNLLAGAILMTSVSSTALLADDKIGITQEVGALITGYYKYSEPDFMHNKSQIQDHPLNNFGLLYNVKNNFLYEGYLNQIEFDSDFKRIKYDYWSNGTGTLSNKDNDIYNLRVLYGIQASDKLMLKTGLGNSGMKMIRIFRYTRLLYTFQLLLWRQLVTEISMGLILLKNIVAF